jgi:hypothetical protein
MLYYVQQHAMQGGMTSGKGKSPGLINSRHLRAPCAGHQCRRLPSLLLAWSLLPNRPTTECLVSVWTPGWSPRLLPNTAWLK